MNTIAGACARTVVNRSRTRAAPTPTSDSTNSAPATEKKATPASPATARARSVLPQPGGPNSSTPFGGAAPPAAQRLGARRERPTPPPPPPAPAAPATAARDGVVVAQLEDGDRPGAGEAVELVERQVAPGLVGAQVPEREEEEDEQGQQRAGEAEYRAIARPLGPRVPGARERRADAALAAGGGRGRGARPRWHARSQ